MRKLSAEQRSMVLSALVEGSSVNATARMCGVSKITVLRLLSDAASLCADYHDLMVRGLQTQRAQADELWSYCGCKAKTKKAGGMGHGDTWTWVLLDSDSKLCVSCLVADRGAESAKVFMEDAAGRIASRIQLTTDGHGAYIDAVDAAFAGEIDYSMLIKHFAEVRPGEARYSPARCTGTTRKTVTGRPDHDHTSTSFVERQNLTVRMGSRRFTRLTNGFSKRLESHVNAVHLHYFHYNFVRKHMTLKTTPAVAAGIASKPMTMLDFVHILENEERVHGGRLTDYLPAFPKAAASE
jgi:hypothetical protein